MYSRSFIRQSLGHMKKSVYLCIPNRTGGKKKLGLFCFVYMLLLLFVSLPIINTDSRNLSESRSLKRLRSDILFLAYK